MSSDDIYPNAKSMLTMNSTVSAQANAAVAEIRPSNMNLLAQDGHVEGPQVPRIFQEQQGIHRDSSSPDARHPFKRKTVWEVSETVSRKKVVATTSTKMAAANL